MLDETARTMEPNLGSVASRLRALASAPAVVAELERQARETVQAHRTAIAALREAEQKFVAAETHREAVVAAAEAKFAPIQERYFKARDEHHAVLAEAELAYRTAEMKAQRALAAIAELPPWPAFQDWRQRVEQILPHTYLDHGPPSVDAYG